MARKNGRTGTASRSFPRPRGDGPHPPNAYEDAGGFSPPTRGWPGSWLAHRFREQVFPAHAGMARNPPLLRGTAFCFPRPRGDGPDSSMRCLHPAQFSPPTRGWPAKTRSLGQHRVVFPAHAGMARHRRRDDAARRRFPRPRGDGPRTMAEETSAGSFSPPTRGWPSIRHEIRDPV